MRLISSHYRQDLWRYVIIHFGVEIAEKFIKKVLTRTLRDTVYPFQGVVKNVFFSIANSTWWNSSNSLDNLSDVLLKFLVPSFSTVGLVLPNTPTKHCSILLIQLIASVYLWNQE